MEPNQSWMSQEQCNNCGKTIESEKAATHLGYCRRNISKCEVCGMNVDKNFIEDHQQEFHLNAKCEHCSKMYKASEINTHSNRCEMKPKICDYCEMKVSPQQFQLHLKACESRTRPCEICNKPVLNKQFTIHSIKCRLNLKSKQNNQTASDQDFEDSLDTAWKGAFKPKPSSKASTINASNNKSTTINASPSPGKKTKNGLSPEEKPKGKSSDQSMFEPYLGNFYDFEDEDSSFYEQNFEEKEKKSPFSKGKFYYGQPNPFEDLIIDDEEQIMQQAIEESTKQSKNTFYPKGLPLDFNSSELMGKSFYNDILDVEKQKAILNDLDRKKKK